MSGTARAAGTVGWIDLTVKDAERLRAFYGDVVGWQSSGVPMGGYEDFAMISPATGEAVAGICHARGGNADMPPVWMVYWVVADLEQSLARCRKEGGEVVVGAREMGDTGRYAIIRDPAGAVAALWQYLTP